MYEKQCKKCGRLLSEFYDTGLLGCPDCYNAFGLEINETLNKIQAQSFHVGKRPKLTFEDRELLNDYKAYLKEKEKAGLQGRFDDMVKLNKIVSDLSEELKRRGLL